MLAAYAEKIHSICYFDYMLRRLLSLVCKRTLDNLFFGLNLNTQI